MKQEELLKQLNEQWVKHIDDNRLFLLLEIDEAAVDLLRECVFFNPNKLWHEFTPSSFPKKKQLYDGYEISVQHSGKNRYVPVTFRLGSYEIQADNKRINSTWRVNAEWKDIYHVYGGHLSVYLDWEKNSSTEAAIEKLFAEFDMLGKLKKISKTKENKK